MNNFSVSADDAARAPTCAQCGKQTVSWWQPLIGIENFCRNLACVNRWVRQHYTDGSHKRNPVTMELTTCDSFAHKGI